MVLYMDARSLREWHPGPGVAVEVGAHNGKGWTFTLEYEGWTVICLEPHPDYFRELCGNRPGAINCCVAASDKTGFASMLLTREGICSSLELGVGDVIREVYNDYHIMGHKEVPCTTLDDLFSTHRAILAGGIDVIVVDTEGHDLAVLRGLDLKRWQPRLLIVEQLPQNQVAGLAKVEAVDELMAEAGYTLAGQEGADSFYARDDADVEWWRGQVGQRWF